MGVQLQKLTPQLADYFGAPAGLLVTEVAEDSAAWKAGLQAGDVLLEVDGREIGSEFDAQEALSQHEAGDVVDVTVQRRGGIDRFSLTLEDQAKPAAGEMTFNIALEGGDSSQFQYHSQVHIETVGSEDWTVGEPITIRISDEEDADSLRARIQQLQQELLTLQERLGDLGED
jgi:membrane-associated protease RseP (regulator of RpoE activity)